MNIKADLRKKYASTEEVNEDISYAILGQIENFLKHKSAKIIGIYLPLKGEIDVTSLMLKFPNLIFAAPKIQDDRICFVHYSLSSPLKQNANYSNYLEPQSDQEIHPDLIFLPAIAYDIRGYRLGRGKGHYDRYLYESNATKVGLIENKKLIEYIPNEEHDQPVDIIITEEIIIDLCQ
jgi:5-formyltetrahydrofolate cyclo-ligase